MPELTRHQLSALLLLALRREALGTRDLFEGRQEPLSWFFRALAYDQSELDILESGAVDTLHAPSALVELAVDELGLALANIEMDGLASYLLSPEEGSLDPESLEIDPEVMLGFLHVDVAPPSLWLEERESDPATNEALAAQLTRIAQEVGVGSDTVEVHIEGALDPEGGWADPREHVRPAGVAVHFSFDIPLAGATERELASIFARGARVAADALERLRTVFRDGAE